jgi:hypothetical protein
VQQLTFAAGRTGWPRLGEALTTRDAARQGTSVALVAGLARTIKGIQLGAATRWAEDRLGDDSRGRVTLDVGAAKDLGVVSAGVAVQSLPLDRLRDDDPRLPTRVALGVNTQARPTGPFDISGNAAVALLRDGRVMPRVGTEVGWSWLDGYAIQLRGGWRRPDFDGPRPWVLGAGVQRDNLSIDYAWEPFDGRDAVHRVGVRIRP